MKIENHPTKIKILQAATRVFGNKGFKGATTKEIAIEADVAEGTLFRHFSSKLEILYGVVESMLPLIVVDTFQNFIAEAENLSAAEAFRHIILDRFAIIEERKTLIRIILTEMQYDQYLREIYLEQVFQPIQQILCSFFEQKLKSGEFRELEPKLLTNILLSMIIHIVFQPLFADERDESLIEAGELLTEVLLYGLMKR